MADKKFQDIVTDVQQTLYQVAGLGVQVYSQDNIGLKINDAFEMIFDEKKWKRFNVRESFTPDGVTGESLTPLQYITRFDDVSRVFVANSTRPLAKLSDETNLDLSYGRAQFYAPSPNAGKIITIYSQTATDVITIVGRAFPSTFPFSGTTVVPFDSLALRYMTAWQYMVDDGANPGAISKLQGLFESRIKQLYDNQTQEPIALSPARGAIPTGWTDASYDY